MAYKSRRRTDRVVMIVGSLVLGGAAAVVAAIGDSERIGLYAASASVDQNGQAQVVEVIDYDFGVPNRHGIFRDVPGLDRTAPIVVESTTAPDQFVIESAPVGTRLRIGDPDRTIDGRNRYVISYPINVGFEDDVLSWNAVGSQWQVGLHNIEVHLLAGNEFTDVQCSRGRTGAWDGCSASQPEPGHLMVEIDELDAGEGITVSGRRGAALDAIPTFQLPTAGDADDPGTGALVPGAIGVVTALLAGAVGSVFIRRSGKEFVWAGGSADAAFGPQYDEQYPVRRVDHDELDRLASTEFAPPKGLTAWQGGVLHAEHAAERHQTAWLLERAIAGEINIEGKDKDLKLTLEQVDSPEHDLLGALFGGRKNVDLSKYDKQFASGWSQLGEQLGAWSGESSFWDPAGERRRGRVVGFGVLAALTGLIVLGVSAVAANRAGVPWLIGVVIGAGVTGLGFAAMLRAWELRVRTPEGSGLWILVESFRRFINGSDAQHVEAAAKQGRLLEYTAWAVALDEADHWAKTLEQADLKDTPGYTPQAVYFAALAPNLGRAASTASTPPSSSGSGGGGGSVGGGGGGGGGGSW